MSDATRWPPNYPGARWYGTAEIKAVAGVVRRRTPFRYYGINTPGAVDNLEATAGAFYGMPYALAVNSGTGALFTTVRALGIGPGDEVVIPSFLWVSTVGAVVAANAIPVICEVDDTFTMDVRDLARKIGPRTRLIVPVHMAGAPCDMRGIMAIARRKGIAVLEDCAQANGASFRGKPVGTFGTAGMFSLQVNKNITSGEGGLLVTRDSTLYHLMCAAHDVGVPWRNGGPDTGTGVVCWGEGRRMGELAGAVAVEQYRRLPAVLRKMRSAKRLMKSMLEDAPGISFRRLHDEDGDSASAMILILPHAAAAKAVVAATAKSGIGLVRIADFGMHVYHNIPQLVMKTPLSPAGNPWSLPANRHSRYNYAKGSCPASDALFERSVLIGMPSGLTKSQASWAARLLRKAIAGAIG